MLAGVVCEYNPFHKGHLYQLEQTRALGADAIVCVMSGNFVQRGECAYLDKQKRAEMAIRCRADVVIDLPVPWAVSSAENFARGSINLLYNFGVDTLSFGSEFDDKELLLLAARAVDDERVIFSVKKQMSEGSGYPVALSSAVREYYGDAVNEVISSPNSTLGVEYIRQLQLYKNMDFIPIKRVGAGHDSDKSDGKYTSASKIRQLLEENEEFFTFMSDISSVILREQFKKNHAPCRMQINERGILSVLREMSVEDIRQYVSDETGLSARIYEASRSAVSLDDLYEKIKSKNFTLARVRREALSAYLKVPKDLAKETPPYIRILAVNEKGLSLLSSAKKKSALPIVTKHGEMQNLNEKAKLVYELQCSSTDKFALFSKSARECGLEQKSSMLIVR